MNDSSLVNGNTVLVHFKKLDKRAITPTKAHTIGDVGFDLISIECVHHENYTEHKTGIALDLPPGYFAILAPRSSQSNYQQILANNIGVIDQSYVGEITVRFRDVPRSWLTKILLPNRQYKVREKIAQLIILPYPNIVLLETNTLSQTERGTKAYGSSGR